MVTAAGPAVDGLSPSRVARPRTPEEVAQALAEAARDRLAVIPVGGGRALGMGDLPDRYDVALDTTALEPAVDHRAADLTVTVSAGVRLEDLRARLEEAGQFLPLDPFGGPGHTVGGLLAAGWTGPLRLRYGAPREFVVGMQVAAPDGRLVRSGGRVVKNVSGYDMTKLHLGAMGSLGVITEATFKVFPKPAAEMTVAATAASLGGAWAAARKALEAPLPPAALELLPPALGGWRLVARLIGTGEAVKRAARDLGWDESDPGFWAEHAGRRSDTWARVAAPRQALQPVLKRLPPGHTWWASPGVGSAHWLDASEPALVSRIRAAAIAAGGSMVLLEAPAGLKRACGAWGPPPADLALMRALRDRFDPARTISPGRYPA